MIGEERKWKEKGKKKRKNWQSNDFEKIKFPLNVHDKETTIFHHHETIVHNIVHSKSYIDWWSVWIIQLYPWSRFKPSAFGDKGIERCPELQMTISNHVDYFSFNKY